MQYLLEVTFKGKAPKPGRCVVCGCTDERACEPPCTWADDGRLLCTTCLARICDQASNPSGPLRPETRSFRGSKPHTMAFTVRVKP